HAGSRAVSCSRPGDRSRDRRALCAHGARTARSRAASPKRPAGAHIYRARSVTVTGMRLDVLMATYNRSDLLARALESFLAADRPAGWEVTFTVIDNRSTDDTKAVAHSFVPRFDRRLRYLYEARPGRSHALNNGIAATTGELVGMIDDDEEVDHSWLTTIAKAFEDPSVDFIGGPYVPK